MRQYGRQTKHVDNTDTLFLPRVPWCANAEAPRAPSPCRQKCISRLSSGQDGCKSHGAGGCRRSAHDQKARDSNKATDVYITLLPARMQDRPCICNIATFEAPFGHGDGDPRAKPVSSHKLVVQAADLTIPTRKSSGRRHLPGPAWVSLSRRSGNVVSRVTGRRRGGVPHGLPTLATTRSRPEMSGRPVGSQAWTWRAMSWTRWSDVETRPPRRPARSRATPRNQSRSWSSAARCAPRQASQRTTSWCCSSTCWSGCCCCCRRRSCRARRNWDTLDHEKDDVGPPPPGAGPPPSPSNRA